MRPVAIPVVETDRLILRGPQPEDLDAFCTFYADERSAPVGGPLESFGVWATLLRTAGHWQMRGYGIWHVVLRETGAPIGHAGILHHNIWPEPELAYAIFAEYEGRGLASEAAAAARDAAAYHFDIRRPISMIAPENSRSRALAERLGASREEDITLLGRTCHVYRHADAEAA